jgi:hypothetical protein
MKQTLFAWIVLLCVAPASHGQSTDGMIFGRVTGPDKVPVDSAEVSCRNLTTNDKFTVNSRGGNYALLSVPSGLYEVTFEAAEYQTKVVRNLEVPVAAQISLDVHLTKTIQAVNEATGANSVHQVHGFIIGGFGLDLRISSSDYISTVPRREGQLATVSEVINPVQMEALPLSGRDIYTTLAMQEGVTTDTVTTRGLGLSANGQRPTASNFLLDGVENNNYFQTGSLTPISPEAVQEYRVSISSFSAEYGRTSGFLANAVTRSGSNQYRGLLFGYVGNDLLNANSFQANAYGNPRAPDKEIHAGYQVGGPILRDRLFFSSQFEQFRSRTRTGNQTVCLPVLASFPVQDRGNLSATLLAAYPPAATPLGTHCTSDPSDFGQSYQWSPTVSIDRSLALERVDYLPTKNDRLMWRSILARSSRPDFVSVPYQGLNSRLSEDSTGVAVGYTRSLGPLTTDALHMGWTNNDLHWNRPHSGVGDIPTLQSSYGVLFPSNPLPYAFANRENDWELSDSLSTMRGAHVLTVGGGFLLRRPHSQLPYYASGKFYFLDKRYAYCNQNMTSIDEFVAGIPCVFQGYFSWPRTTPGPLELPNYTRAYSNQQFDGFIQDTWRVWPRLSLSMGLRYESLGSLRETGAQDPFVQAGPGDSPYAQLQGASLVRYSVTPRSLYSPDRRGWAPRLGISYGLDKTVLRASFGVFYDRPFDNLLETGRVSDLFLGGNRYFDTPPQTLDAGSFRLASPAAIVAPFSRIDCCPTMEFWIDQHLRTPKVYSWFAGFDRELMSNLTLEVNHLGSSGRRLLTVDWVNRPPTNPAIPATVAYLANQGSSFYAALSAVLRYRARPMQFQIAYTWSHSIDNQSDPLLGGLDLGLGTVNGSGSTGNSVFQCALDCNSAFFTQQFNWRIDRGNSAFDQRQNLIFYAIWNLPHPRSRFWLARLSSSWRIAGLASFRSGFPVSVSYKIPSYAGDGDAGDGFQFTNRPDLTGQAIGSTSGQPVPRGAVSLLNPSAFRPANGVVGNLGRNSIPGPGFWDMDASLARSIPLFGGEARYLEVRVDAFNTFNHANLGAPQGDWSSPQFGQAQYGVAPQTTGSAALSPLAAQQRQVQLLIKFHF